MVVVVEVVVVVVPHQQLNGSWCNCGEVDRGEGGDSVMSDVIYQRPLSLSPIFGGWVYLLLHSLG